MELRVNDYVRTEKGTITKYNAHDILLNKFENRYYYTYDTEESYSISELVVKSSPNIIDLIEVGDYVNGYRVSYSGGFYQYWDDMFDKNTIETEKDIKSIVTKEQFESMEYKVGE